MIIDLLKKIKKVDGYLNVKNKVSDWLVAGEDAEKKGLYKVKLGRWYKRDLYQALIALNQLDCCLIPNYGREYIEAGGAEPSILSIIESKGALLSVSGITKFLKRNGINNTLAIYSIGALAVSDNGVNIAKALYSELAKRNVKKSLPYGIWSAIHLDDSDFTAHVLKRLAWCGDSKAVSLALDQVFSVESTIKSDFLDLTLKNVPAKVVEKLIRKNIDQLDYKVLAKTLLNNPLDIIYKGILKKIAAHIWSIKQYPLAGELYGKLLALSPEQVIAERYLLSYERAGLKTDDSLSFISDIKAGLSLLKCGETPDDVWFSTFPAIARKSIDDIVSTGHLSLAIDICHQVNFEHNKLKHWQDLLLIKDNGLAIPNKVIEQKEYNSKVAYLLYNSLPVHSGGYATRSHGIISNVVSKGIVPHVMTRLGYPYDLNEFKHRALVTKEEYDGITYHRLLEGPGLNFVPVQEYLASYVANVKQQLIDSDSSVVHAASNHLNGIAGVIAGRELGLKTIFEVRGMWEVTRLSRQPAWEGSEEFKAYRYLETLAALEADVVITITEALKHELVTRGVSESKIHVVSNGVDTEIFEPQVPNMELKQSLGIPKDNSVIGYVGSIVDYEGLDILVDSIKLLVESGQTKITALIVGDGVALDGLKEQVAHMKLDDYFVFTGRIPHDSVPNYYSIIDICPFPRRGLPVCELVSPLKPFEAMAMGKVVIGSSVQAIAEFIEEGINGFVHEKDSADDLAKKIACSIESEEIRERLELTTRDWVVKNRDWKVLANKVFDIYEGFK